MSHHTRRPVIGLTYSSTDIAQFTLWRNMIHGFIEAGASLVTIDCHFPQQDLRAQVAHLDGLVLSGGADVDPALYGGDVDDPLITRIDTVRDENEESALTAAIDLGIPVLAICRGMQFVNASFGGTLHGDITRDIGDHVPHRRTEATLDRILHDVEVEPDSLLARWMGASGLVAVNSEHHQGIRTLGSGLTPVATASDGLIEAVELPAHRLVGVQWHPEILWPNNLHALDLLRGFVHACAVLVRQPNPA